MLKHFGFSKPLSDGEKSVARTTMDVLLKHPMLTFHYNKFITFGLLCFSLYCWIQQDLALNNLQVFICHKTTNQVSSVEKLKFYIVSH